MYLAALLLGSSVVSLTSSFGNSTEHDEVSAKFREVV